MGGTADRSERSRLVAVTLDEASIGRSTPDIEHERNVAIYDLVEDNAFALPGRPAGAYALHLSIVERRLVFDIREADGTPVVTHILSLTPFTRIVRDYFLVCDSYYQAIRSASPSRIEAIDMGRRALHDEGSALLSRRLAGKIEVDPGTARRLFTLLCVLHWKG